MTGVARWLVFVSCALVSACAIDTGLDDDDAAEHDEGDEDGDLAAIAQSSALGAAGPYQWPIKPFDKQHPVRGFLNDPRQGKGGSEAFHFGIDIAAPDGTAVYAVEAGKLHLSNPLTLAVISPGRTIAYWHMRHVFSANDNGKRVEKGQLLGRIEKGWGHVHLGESRGGKWVNPLRRGGITPFVDLGAPTIEELKLSTRPARGKIDIVVNAFDRTPVRVQDPSWDGMPVGVPFIRWRVLRADGAPAFPRDGDWKVGVDLRDTMLDRSGFDEVFAPPTRQNHPNRPGTYDYFLAHGWDSTVLANGFYQMEIEASDIRGNTAKKLFGFTVQN